MLSDFFITSHFIQSHAYIYELFNGNGNLISSFQDKETNFSFENIATGIQKKTVRTVSVHIYMMKIPHTYKPGKNLIHRTKTHKKFAK